MPAWPSSHMAKSRYKRHLSPMPEITSQLSTALSDRYKIESHIGEGGMATVYLAHDLKHDRKVALKVLRPELAAVIGSERFLQEIRVTANLQHPHILPLHDSGDAGSFLYYVMPYIEGDTLRDKLDREKQLAIEDAIDITRSIASALDYAHRQGVIHRDIKPENILIHDGQALVADFGIALAVSHASGQRLTETGLSIGTPHYMSPEQAMGDRELDARSDVYSLGAMLYEMLAGEPPYQGSSAQAIVAKVITEKAPPVTAARDTVPGHINAAIIKALNKMPADRFSTAATFADALTNTAFTIPSTATMPAESIPVATRSRKSTALLVLGAALVLTAVFLGGRMTTGTPEIRLTRFLVPAPEGVLGYSRCCGPTVALSPDGEWMVFVGGGGGEGRSPLYRRRLGQLEAEEIPGTDDASIPFFSPDGRWLGFYSDGRIRKVPMTGGPPVPIFEIARAEGASWGDKDVIIFSDNNSLHTVPAGGGVATPVPTPADMRLIHPSALPGGVATLARVAGSSPAEARIVVVDLESGSIDTIGFGTYARYASGYLVFSGADGSLLAQPFDPSAQRTTGQAMAILDGLRLAGPSLGEFALSAEGGLAYQPGVGSRAEVLALVGPNGSTTLELPQDGNLENPTFSPDGRRVAFVFSDVGSRVDIWIFDIDQGTMPNLTAEGTRNRAPVWTRDGSRVVFSSDRNDEVGQLYWKPSDGSGTAERLLVSDYEAYPQSWFPDGQTLAIVADRNGTVDIGFLTLGDSTPRWVLESEFDEWEAQISPDGRWLAYTSDRSGSNEIYVVATTGEGGHYQVSTEGGRAPRWSPDGAELYFVSSNTLIASTVSVDSGFRIASRVSRGTVTDLDNLAPNYDIHPNGEDILIIDQEGGQGARGLIWIQNWTEIIREMTTGR